MNQLFLLDTNMVSYIIKGKSPAARAKNATLHPDQVACISAITEGEIRYGLAKSTAGPKLATALEWFLLRVRVLPWGSPEASVYGQLRAQQEAAGKPLGSMDLLIAAHAIAVRATLVTNDKAFASVPELPGLANWATDL